MLFLVLLALTLAQFWLGNRVVHYSVMSAHPTSGRRSRTRRQLGARPGWSSAPRKKWLPFSAWHFLLMPVAIVMLVPLVWVVMTSLETLAQTQPLPADPVARHVPVAQLPERAQQRAVRPVVLEHHRGHDGGGRLEPGPVLARRVRRSRGSSSSARGVAYFFLLATLLVPLQVVLIPTFLIVKQMHLLNTLGALIVPNLANVFGIFLLTQFFRTLPIELEEAARIDGASRV